jgi:hypothetical protein
MKTLLLILVAFTGFTAAISGLLIISNPADGGVINLSINLLKETPFNNFLIPGIILTAMVGGTNLLALFYIIQRKANRYNWAMAGGLMISGWIIVQMILIRQISWLQFFYLIIGLLIILIAYQLKGKWAV